MEQKAAGRKPRQRKPAADTNTTTEPPVRKRAPKMVIVHEPETTSAIELRKAVEALTMRNASSTGDLTFLQRKLFNSMLQIAQNRPAEELSHTVPISEFETLVGHTTSNSRDYLKQVFRQMMSMQVEFDFKGDSNPKKKSSWGIANMVAEVYILEEINSIKFSFPPELKKRLLDPEVYNRIDLRMQNRFSSYSALALYEIVSRYHGSSFKETWRDHWTTWSTLLSGSHVPHTEFRDFNKMLSRAIEQVNTHESRFNIVAHSTKKERKIDKLWFVLESQVQPQLTLTAPPSMIGSEVTKRLRGLGLSDADVTSFGMDYDEEYLLAQADNTEARMKKKGAEPLASPVAYFKAAVLNNYAKAPKRPTPGAKAGQADQETPNKTPKQTPQNGSKGGSIDLEHLKDAWKNSKTTEIKAELEQLDKDELLKLLSDYDEKLKATLTARIYRKIQSSEPNKTVITHLAEAVFSERYTEPNSDELLRFLLESGAKG